MEKARERFASLHDADYITMRNAELDMFGAEDLYYLALEIEDGKAESVYADLLPCEIELITLNDTAIVGTQGELFVEYGLAIKARSKYKKNIRIQSYERRASRVCVYARCDRRRRIRSRKFYICTRSGC